jgi:hypothetical protein
MEGQAAWRAGKFDFDFAVDWMRKEPGTKGRASA